MYIFKIHGKEYKVRFTYRMVCKGDLLDKVSNLNLDEMDVHNLACAAILQAVEDWKALEYGKIEARKFLNQRIEKSKLLAFFYSRKFEMLLHMALPEYTPDQIRRALRVPTRVWGVVR